MKLLVEDIVYAWLKCGRIICQSKRHGKKLKVTIMTFESSIWYVFLPHSNLMITIYKVKIWEELCSMDLIHELINPWDGIFILHCLLVQCSQINAHPQGSILFLYHNNWRSIRACTRSYETQFQEFFNWILNIIFNPFWVSIGMQFDRLNPYI